MKHQFPHLATWAGLINILDLTVTPCYLLKSLEDLLALVSA